MAWEASLLRRCAQLPRFYVLSGQRKIHRGIFRQMSSASAEEHVPVLIVGAGPVGLVLSILLTKLGVKCAVIERSQQFRKHPQAHFINNRTMEVFRKLDGLSGEIEELQPSVEQWRKFIYCSSLSGTILGTVDHMQPNDLKQTRSPTCVAHFSQHRLVPLLLKRLEKLGFSIYSGDNPSSEGYRSSGSWIGKIKLCHECVSINPTSDGIRAAIYCVENGLKVVRDIHCSVLIGADGAGSTVRKLMGISLKGEQDMQKLISVHFLSKELGHFLSEKRPGMLYFVFNPKIIGVVVAHDLNEGEFVVQIPFYPPQQRFEDFSTEVCREFISNLIGYDHVDLEIKSIKPWAMHAEVAEKFTCGNHRVILVGDAAHRFPPAGGFGMNTGIQDAHNLAWKLAYVLNGLASPDLLSTYEMERKPIAEFNTALSVANFKAAMSVPSALGLNPNIADSVHQTVNNGIGSILPSGLQTVLLESIFALGRAQLSAPFLSRYNPLGSSRLEKVKHILEDGQSLQLQFPAEDLGFRYEQGSVVPELNISNDILEEKPIGRRRDYIPSSKPGSRLPHMQIRILSQHKCHLTKDVCSTLDLVHGNMTEFLLIIAPTSRSYVWADATLKIAKACMVPLKVCIIWPGGSSSSALSNQSTYGYQENEALITSQRQPVVKGGSVVTEDWRRKNLESVLDAEEITGSWWELCEMPYQGAILVRPDEHIAWRSDPSFSGDALDELNRVFSILLKKPALDADQLLHIKSNA
ncbi:hypothetical protein KI387_024266 [Taxus chinensis]|uniref:FAD-binding domain-containing protein n=1 Tax=Taxus chinensis TaxID=29808 RepID=A0AA38G309_TAXCH|nr:hypothetical protein KI387_024266 [Taxus chinensis]